MTTAKLWTMGGFLLGILVSIAGNVLHAWHPDAAALAAAGVTAEQWRPELSAQLFSAFYPVALLVTVEVLARVPWPRSWGWAAARYGGASLVAAVAGIVSYMHLSGLLAAYGESRLIVLIGPLAVDGLMVVCGFALLALGHHKSRQTVQPDVDLQLPQWLICEQQTQPSETAPAAVAAADTPELEATEDLPAPAEEAAEPSPHIHDEAPAPEAEPAQDFSRPVESSAPAQPVVTGLASAVISARAAGLSLQKIADEFGVTKYQVTKILKAAEPDTESAIDAAPVLEPAGV